MTEHQDPEWRILAALSLILIFNSLVTGFAPLGPWNDDGFSLGVMGLVGMALGYVAWFRFNFKRNGLIPWIDLWVNPESSAKKEMLAAALVLGLSWISGNHLQNLLPDPTGLLLSLVGLLLLLHSSYVLLSLGPLNEN